MTIVTRTAKGSELTYSELDGNFTDLDRRTAAGWNDIVGSITTVPGTNSPITETMLGGIVGYNFSPTTNQECFSNFHVRHDYVAGTMVYPHVHWLTKTASAGTVRFGFEYTLARRHDSTGLVTFPQTQTLFIEHTVAPNSQFVHFVNESPDGQGIDSTDLETDAIILSRIYRDAEHPNDTFPDSIFLLFVDIHYQCNIAQTPSRFPPFL